mmetsp:Transcript_99775/g.122049  ORF Transcript_99775/g.122049 Transcript_99775/m.122049 type:complete len:147 (-) Transcript_99775:233-673(-)
MCWIAFPLICADPLRHVLSDQDVWKSCQRRCGDLWPQRCDFSSNEYKCALTCDTYRNGTACPMNSDAYVDCICVHDYQETIHHLAPMGWLFTITFTWIGFALFVVGSLWNANIIEKLREVRHKWRVLRGNSIDSTIDDDDEYNDDE